MNACPFSKWNGWMNGWMDGFVWHARDALVSVSLSLSLSLTYPFLSFDPHPSLLSINRPACTNQARFAVHPSLNRQRQPYARTLRL
mmetsp:Transcript_20313/g.49352  ORF Transcript_20313/g.49352 Transcript_20313/m.49352 type:complete len:86 (-) Transcript_20313:886-1143(-)